MSGIELLTSNVAIKNEKVWLQNHGVLPNTGTDQAAGIQACLNLAESVNEHNGVVSGEPGSYNLESTTKQIYGATSPIEEPEAALHIPSNVAFEGGAGAKSLVLKPSNLGVGKFVVGIHGAAWDYAAMKDIEIASISAQPATYATSATPPEAMDAILTLQGMSLENVHIAPSKIRFGQVSGADHISSRWCDYSGAWGALNFPAGMKHEADCLWLQCDLTGAFCSVFVSKGARCLANRFIGGHMGVGGGPVMYMRESEVGQSFLLGNKFYGVSVEEGGRGYIVDDEMHAVVSENRWWAPSMGGGQDGPLGGRSAGDPTQPVDAFLKAGSFINNQCLGGILLGNLGYDPTLGCGIRASGNVTGNDFGDLTIALEQAESYGLPLMRVAGKQADNTGYRFIGSGAARQRLTFRKLDGAVRRRDVVRKTSAVTSGSGAQDYQHAKQFDTAGAVPAGIAIVSGSTNDNIPVIAPDSREPSVARVNVAHLGGAESEASQPTEPTGSTTLSEALQLGTGEAPPRLLHGTSFPQATVALTTLADLPTGGGVVAIQSNIVTYTSAAVVGGIAQLEGCTGGTTFVERGYAIGRAAVVASLTGFSSTGGALKINTTFATYRGTKETGGKKYIYGISSAGGGEIASGKNVVAQSAFKIKGSGDDYPAGPASAWCSNNSLQFSYEAFLADKINAPSISLTGYFIGIAHISGSSPAASWAVVGGTTLASELKSGETKAKVSSTTGFPSSGVVRLGTHSYPYTGVSAEEFTGLSGVATNFEVGQPVTPAPGGQCDAERPVRPRFSTATSNANDKGLATESAGPGDANGYLLGSAAHEDEGGIVLVEV